MKVLNLLMLVTVVLTACSSATEQASRENYGVVKSSLEIIRGGKTYELLLGYRSDNLSLNESPKQELPANLSANPRIEKATIQWSGDIDNDGEIEYIIEIIYCGGKCSSDVQVIHYDPAKDEYHVFDSIKSLVYVDGYHDIDKDGNPEIVTKDYDYNLKVGGCGGCTGVSPIQIYHYDKNQKKFVVTNQFPDSVRKDADAFLTSIRENYEPDANDLMLAGYLYDMYILGKQDEGLSTYQEVCAKYVQPKMGTAYWTCDKYLVRIISILEEMKIGSK